MLIKENTGLFPLFCGEVSFSAKRGESELNNITICEQQKLENVECVKAATCRISVFDSVSH